MYRYRYDVVLCLADVHIQTLVPSLLRTNMMGKFKPENSPSYIDYLIKLISVEPDTYVRSAINTIGWSSYCHGHFKHYLQSLALSITPQSVLDQAGSA